VKEVIRNPGMTASGRSGERRRERLERVRLGTLGAPRGLRWGTESEGAFAGSSRDGKILEADDVLKRCC